MATSPEVVRTGLLTVTSAAQADIRAVSQAAVSDDPTAWRAALFAAAPLVVDEYAPASSALALDWFEEIREEAAPSGLYVPTPRIRVTDDDVAAMVARTTEALHEVTRELADEVERLMAEAEALLAAEVQKQVASAFWDTITENTGDDPFAKGWQRHTRGDGCKFCRMLAARGAVYDKASVRFAAHTNCHCVVGPSYDPDAPRADVMQYVASRRKRTPEERAALREYLNENFPDAPG